MGKTIMEQWAGIYQLNIELGEMLNESGGNEDEDTDEPDYTPTADEDAERRIDIQIDRIREAQ